MDRLAALTTAERDRLERFAGAFERLGAPDYAPLAPAPDAAADRAMGDAVERLGSAARRSAVREAVARFQAAAARAYSDRMSLPDALLVYQSLADRGEDRLRFQAGLERAVVAVVLWDDLPDETLAALLGPWGVIVQRAIGDPEARPGAG